MTEAEMEAATAPKSGFIPAPYDPRMGIECLCRDGEIIPCSVPGCEKLMCVHEAIAPNKSGLARILGISYEEACRLSNDDMITFLKASSRCDGCCHKHPDRVPRPFGLMHVIRAYTGRVI